MKRYLVTEEQFNAIQEDARWSLEHGHDPNSVVDFGLIEIPDWTMTIVCHGRDENHDQQEKWIEVPT